MPPSSGWYIFTLQLIHLLKSSHTLQPRGQMQAFPFLLEIGNRIVQVGVSRGWMERAWGSPRANRELTHLSLACCLRLWHKVSPRCSKCNFKFMVSLIKHFWVNSTLLVHKTQTHLPGLVTLGTELRICSQSGSLSRAKLHLDTHGGGLFSDSREEKWTANPKVWPASAFRQALYSLLMLQFPAE